MSASPVLIAAPAALRGNQGESRALAGILIVLAVLALRCLTSFDPFPYWSGDPLESPAPVAGLTPSLSLLLDITTAIGAVLAYSAMRASELRRAAGALLAAAVTTLIITRQTRGASGLDNFVYGSMHTSAFVAAAVIFALAGRKPVQRVTLAVLLGVLGTLLARAVQQVYVEHPRTLENFHATREQFFRAQGWTPDSTMAKAFERRLSQAEANGYFGMANALATVGATGLAVAAGLWLTSRSHRTSHPPTPLHYKLSLTALTLACVWLVWSAGAKGGFAAAALGLCTLAAGLIWQRRNRSIPHTLTRLIGPAAVILTLAAVITRGVIGTRMGELSILFRWFYMQAASRIIAEHPWTGVGAMGFKAAYLLAKSPISPEEVTSPHSVLLDYLAMFGVGGAALALVWVFWVSLGATELVHARDEIPAAHTTTHTNSSTANLWKPTALVLTLATIAAIALERAELTPDGALTRLAGLALALWFAAGALKVLHASPAHSTRLGLGAAVIACAAHSQIELTSVTPGAGAWCLVFLALAAGWSSPNDPGTHHAPPLKRAACAVAILLVFIGATLQPTRAVFAWQSALERAYEGTEQAAEVSSRRNALATQTTAPGFEHDSPAALAKDLSTITGAQVNANPLDIDRAVARLRLAAATRSLSLMPAPTLGHFPTLRARTRLALIQAESHAGLGSPREARAAVTAGRTELDAHSTNFSTSANFWAWIGTYEEAAAELETRSTTPDPQAVRTHQKESLRAWQAAHERGPFELLPAKKALALAEALGDTQTAHHWASKCLALNDLLRLDPLEQLSPTEVDHCKALLRK